MEWKWPKRSHRDVDTYFAGYEKQEHVDPQTGRRKTEYVYHGDYYIFNLADEAWRSFRTGTILRVVFATALFAAAHILGPRGSVLPWIGIPAVLSIIPLCFLWMGLITMLGVKTPRMTIRQYCFGLERLENVLWILLVLWAVAAVGELIYLIAKAIFTGAELLAAGMELAAPGLMILQQKRQSDVLALCVHKPETPKK